MVDRAKRRFFTRREPVSDKPLLPWLKDHARFTDQCSRCAECVKACETQIIVSGDGGFPQIDFSQGECTFCYQCAERCPENLFVAKQNSPWDAKASINAQCLALQNVECRACAESCEQSAIVFQLAVGRVAQPKLNTELCNGCGACVATCPTSSILVRYDSV